MKTILRDVQLAIAGTSEDGRAITADLLRNIASNFKGNQYPHIVKNSLSQKAKTHGVVGYVTSVYLKEYNGECELFGDLEFTQLYDMSALKETFGDRVYPTIAITVPSPGYESLCQLAFTDNPFIKGMRQVNFRECVCVGREEDAQIMLEQSAVRFNKKHDNNDSGIINYVKNEGSETPTMQGSPFIHAPGLSRKELIEWLNDVYVALYTEKSDYASRVADIEKKKQDINNDLNKRMETLKKAFPQLDPESILSQDRKAI
ncbi:hypothetical protein DT160_22980 [Salmonella enterica subsp. enterica serovar Mikawasima]|nr:hypothetical protein [Salmonella enterica subsp. enterica serovar Mikawasima]